MDEPAGTEDGGEMEEEAEIETLEGKYGTKLMNRIDEC